MIVGSQRHAALLGNSPASKAQRSSVLRVVAPQGTAAAVARAGRSSRPSVQWRGIVRSAAEGVEVAHGEEVEVHGDASLTAGAVVLDGPKKPKKASITRNIVFITSEVTPWSKSGGLADVCSSLPIALAQRGHRVMVVSPRYKNYEGARDTGVRKVIGEYAAEVAYFHEKYKGVDFVFVDHPSYPRQGGMYSDKDGPYGDNAFRYSLLTLAGLEAPLLLHLTPPPPSGSPGDVATGEEPCTFGQNCVFVANDWMTSLAPVYLAAQYRRHGVYEKARCLLTIHNLVHQGVFSPYYFKDIMLPGDYYGAVEYQYPPHLRMGSYEEEGRALNFLKAGITCSDRVVTVSPGYGEEIKTYLGGWGIEHLLIDRAPVLNGIVNGIDMDDWNPATDPKIPYNYDTTNFVEGKKKCKMALQEEMGLPVNENIPLVAFIGRLDPQKGADILLQAAPNLLHHSDMQLVCLGSGAAHLEDDLRALENNFRDRARAWVGFNEPFSHRLTAAADILLMPSRFEPCGLNQLYAMRYGTVPVAHKTGGLRDTVVDFDPWNNVGTGWTYTNCDADGLSYAVGMALLTLKQHPEDFRKLQLRGMNRDSSWDEAAQQYEQLFEWSLMDPPFCG